MIRRLYYISYDLGFLSIHCHEIIGNLMSLGVRTELFVPKDADYSFQLHDECTLHKIPVVFSRDLLKNVSYQVMLGIILLVKIMKCNRPDVIYARQNYLGIFPIMLSRIFGIPYFLELNGLTKRAEKRPGNVKLWMKGFLERMCVMLGSVIITPSKTLKRRIIKRYRVRSKKIYVVPNGANTELFCPNDNSAALQGTLGFSATDFVVGFVGSMGEWQGVEVIKNAIPLTLLKDKEIRFLIVGDYIKDSNYGRMKEGFGEGQKDIWRFIESNSLKYNVVYHNYVPYEESAQYMNICDVLVAPYTKSYLEVGGGSPMKLYAYLACGKPVIISDLGDFTDADMLKRARAAVLIAPDDSRALAKAIMKLRRNSELLTEVGKRARDFVMRERMWLHSAIKILNVYKRECDRDF